MNLIPVWEILLLLLLSLFLGLLAAREFFRAQKGQQRSRGSVGFYCCVVVIAIGAGPALLLDLPPDAHIGWWLGLGGMVLTGFACLLFLAMHRLGAGLLIKGACYGTPRIQKMLFWLAEPMLETAHEDEDDISWWIAQTPGWTQTAQLRQWVIEALGRDALALLAGQHGGRVACEAYRGFRREGLNPWARQLLFQYGQELGPYLSREEIQVLLVSPNPKIREIGLRAAKNQKSHQVAE